MNKQRKQKRKFLEENEKPGPWKRRWFGLKAPEHRWHTVHSDVGRDFQECKKAGCSARRIICTNKYVAEQKRPKGWETADSILVSDKQI